MPPAVSGVPGGSPRPRAGVPARDGRPNRRRRLPPGDLYRRAARLPASACGQSARLGLHHRAAQGDRPPALALPPCPAGGRRRAATGAAGGGRPALRRRPPVPRRRRGARHLGGGGTPQRPRGLEEAAQERGGAEGDDDMTDFIEALATRAADEGLLDVAYATLDSPVGELVVAATDRGLVRIGLPGEPLDSVLSQLADGVSPRVLSYPRRLDEARRELDQYFAGRREHFEPAVDWRLSHPGFYRRVLRETAKVPFGEMITYGQAAKRAGSPRAFRAAGTALGANPVPIVVPCHRVVRTGGDIGNYGGGPEMKRFLLELE